MALMAVSDGNLQLPKKRRNSLFLARDFPYFQRASCIPAHEGMLHSVAFPLEDQQMSVMDKPVDHRRRHLVIRKDTSPFREFQIGCQDQALALITVRYNAKQQLGSILTPIYVGC